MKSSAEKLLKSIPHSHGDIELQNHEVHLWLVSYRELYLQSADMAEIISGVEKRRSERYRFLKDQQNYIFRHGVLRILIARYMSIEPGDVRFRVGDYGKPHLDGMNKEHSFEFNISHSGDMLLLGFARGHRIGVDIEFNKPIEDMDAIIKTNFSHNEKLEFDSLPADKRLEAFYRGWTQKEAFVKALGDGLSRDLDQFDVSMTPGEPAALKRTAWDGVEATRWTLETIQTVSGYSASVAMEGTGLKFIRRELSLGLWG